MERHDQAHEELVDRACTSPRRLRSAGSLPGGRAYPSSRRRARTRPLPPVLRPRRRSSCRQPSRPAGGGDRRRRDPGRRNQCRGPRTEHQHGCDVHTGREAELLGIGRLARALVALDLEELRQDRRQRQQRERSRRSVQRCRDRADGRDKASVMVQSTSARARVGTAVFMAQRGASGPTSCRRLRPRAELRKSQVDRSTSDAACQPPFSPHDPPGGGRRRLVASGAAVNPPQGASAPSPERERRIHSAGEPSHHSAWAASARSART